ncbi:hypothetical protein [Agitococcus lubricus]|uniref:Uncharacterized protein n=1 Tax=Agitococcus lubricus TaxID=1077255 RepID=A0A2T5ITC2_9GAMM|nr:hypothetical protein [Agitococcus lubricus]PTQ87066.1 hypothetical protein C8N29_12511 [Agitococcus lubricus]
MKSYQTKHSFDTVLGCFFATQKLSNQTSIDAFLARQKRIKARRQAQNTGNTIAATATANADTSDNQGVNHVE